MACWPSGAAVRAAWSRATSHPVAIHNARRGLAKPSSHGSYLAMDIEPVDRASPITRAEQRTGRRRNRRAVADVRSRMRADDRAARGIRSGDAFERLIGLADRAGAPLGDVPDGDRERHEFRSARVSPRAAHDARLHFAGIYFSSDSISTTGVSRLSRSGRASTAAATRDCFTPSANSGWIGCCRSMNRCGHGNSRFRSRRADWILRGVSPRRIAWRGRGRPDVASSMRRRIGRANSRRLSGRSRPASASGFSRRPRSTRRDYRERFSSRRAIDVLRVRAAKTARALYSDCDEPMPEPFSIHVAKENLKFSAAHFIAYPGFREPLHGHNYQVGVYVEGRLAKTGYVIDFGLIKKLTKEIVDRLDERTIVPDKSDCLTIDGHRRRGANPLRARRIRAARRPTCVSCRLCIARPRSSRATSGTSWRRRCARAVRWRK